MNHTRRTFLQTSTLLAASLPFANLLRGSAAPAAGPGAAAGQKTGGGLLFDESDLPRIRANARDPRFAELWKTMNAADLAADRDFLENKLSLTNHVVDMLHAQKILDRTCVMYAVTGDAAQLDLAKLAIKRMLDYPEWDSFIEGGRQIFGLQRAPEGSISLLLALDYLKGALSPKEIAEIEHAVVTKGAPACYTAIYGMKYPDRVQGWTWSPRSDVDAFRHISLKRWPLILNATNLKIIPTAALGIIACHFLGRNAEAPRWMELARSSAKAFSTIYGSDGSYDEGVSYWGYTTLHMALFAEVLFRTQGIDERALINYPGTARYALGMTMPTLPNNHEVANFQHIPGFMMPMLNPDFDIVNFGDANGAVDVSVASWIGRVHQDPVANYLAKDVGEAKFYYGLIWYDGAAKATAPGPELLDQRLSNDIVISRTGWTARDNLVALRSGGPGNHEHADRNSIIFKAYGERLFHDPTRAAYASHQPRWILRLTEAHTAVLINGKGHQYHDGSEGTNASWALARVTGYSTGKDSFTGQNWMAVTSDATEAYQLVDPKIILVQRTLLYIKPDLLAILDRVKMKDAKASVQVRFQANNEDMAAQLSTKEDEFTIARPFASLVGRVMKAPGREVRIDKLPLDPKDGNQPFAEVVSAPAETHDILTVCTARPTGGDHGTLTLRLEPEGWHIVGVMGAQKINLVFAVTAEGVPVLNPS